MTDVIQVYVGTDRSQALAVDVLAYSIRRHTNRPVEVRSMLDLKIPEPRDIRQGQRTGFSFARWAIPELAGYSGRAIYVDADMLVFRDIHELWSVPMDGAKLAVLAPERATGRHVRYKLNETSVMVLDCARCRWTLRDLVAGLDGRYTYEQLMSDLCFLGEADIARTIPADWNRLEHYTPETGLLHYTVMPTQPWVSARNPLGHLWIEEVRRMIGEGALDAARIREEIALGYFRPSLMVEIEEGPADTGDARRIERLEALDRAAGYVPHRSVREFDRRRAAAVAAYERRLAREAGALPYARFVGAEMLRSGREKAAAVKRRILGG
jgi:hypothetical protein